MMYKKVKILYLCGHSENRILNQDERIDSSKIEKYERSLCDICREKKQLIDCIYSNMQKAEELGLPKLCGSFDQIILANQIRMKFIEEYIVLDEKDIRKRFKKYCEINSFDIVNFRINIDKKENLKRLVNFIIYNITDAKIWEESIIDYDNLLYIGGLSFNNW